MSRDHTNRDQEDPVSFVDRGVTAVDAGLDPQQRAATPSAATPSAAIPEFASHPVPPARLPKLFETDSGVILLSDVSSVQCYADQRSGGPICQVTLRSGVTFFVGIQYSRGLIEAVKAHHADGSPVRRVEVSPTSVVS